MSEKYKHHKCKCGKAFEYAYLLVRHLKGKHECDKVNKTIKEYICDNCGNKLSNGFSLKRHKTTCITNQSLENTILDSEEENQDHDNDLESFFSNFDNIKEFLNNKDNKISKNDVQNVNENIKNIYKIIEKYFNINSTINNINTNNTNSNERPTLFDNTQFDQSIIESIQIDESTTNNISNTTNNNTNNDNSITNNDNSITNNNTNNDNSVTNNNNVVNNISIIYPFGYENLSHLSQNEMIKILLSNDILMKALVSVYSNQTNQCYHKHNDKSDKILLLNNSLALDAKDDSEFVSEIIENTILAIKRMFFICKNKFSFENQLTIWNNINYVHNTIRTEMKKKPKHMPINCKTLINKISSLVLLEKKNSKYIIKDNTKQKINNFEEFKAKIDIDPIYKDNVLNLFEVVYDELKKYKESLNDVSITDEILRQYWSDPEDDIELNNEHNDVSKVKVEDTPRYKYYKKMIKNENKELAKSEHSLGNLNAISKIRSERAEAEVETLSEEFNLSDLQTRLIRNKLITEPISENISKISKLNVQMAN